MDYIWKYYLCFFNNIIRNNIKNMSLADYFNMEVERIGITRKMCTAQDTRQKFWGVWNSLSVHFENVINFLVCKNIFYSWQINVIFSFLSFFLSSTTLWKMLRQLLFRHKNDQVSRSYSENNINHGKDGKCFVLIGRSFYLGRQSRNFTSQSRKME